jgi:hypothetical protein
LLPLIIVLVVNEAAVMSNMGVMGLLLLWYTVKVDESMSIQER